MTEFAPIDPFALQQGEIVQVCAALSDGTCLPGKVALVDTRNFYVSVLFDGTQYPVSLPMDDWLFQTARAENFIPTDDGMYVEVVEEGDGAVFRRKDGVWTNLDTGEVVAEADLPALTPLVAVAPKQNFSPDDTAGTNTVEETTA